MHKLRTDFFSTSLFSVCHAPMTNEDMSDAPSFIASDVSSSFFDVGLAYPMTLDSMKFVMI